MLKSNSALVLLVLLTLQTHRCCQAQTDPGKAPAKPAMIGVLQQVFPLLEKKDFAAAAEHFVLPPDFEPQMLDGLIEKREISAAGIRILENDAKFGQASEMFGEERAKHFAGRASVDVEKCFGFNHETEAATAEVIAVWDGTRLKLIRLDDVGKLEPGEKTGPDQTNQKTDLAEVLPILEASVKKNPNDVAARAKYAMALFQVGNLPAAWAQLVEARKLQPDHGGIAIGMEVLLSAYESKGLFVVGVPSATILSLLGEPEKKVELKGRQRWVYAFLALDFKSDRLHEIVDLRGATEALFQPTETVSVELDGRGWYCGVRKKSRGSAGAFYYLPGESITKWTEQVEIERILNGAAAGSFEEIGKKLTAQMRDRHPGATGRVLSTDADSIIVAFVIPATGDSEKRHQLVRLMKGPVDMHRLAYTVKTDDPSEELQQRWLAIFKSAALNKVESQSAPDDSP